MHIDLTSSYWAVASSKPNLTKQKKTTFTKFMNIVWNIYKTIWIIELKLLSVSQLVHASEQRLGEIIH